MKKRQLWKLNKKKLNRKRKMLVRKKSGSANHVALKIQVSSVWNVAKRSQDPNTGSVRYVGQNQKVSSALNAEQSVTTNGGND